MEMKDKTLKRSERNEITRKNGLCGDKVHNKFRIEHTKSSNGLCALYTVCTEWWPKYTNKMTPWWIRWWQYVSSVLIAYAYTANGFLVNNWLAFEQISRSLLCNAIQFNFTPWNVCERVHAHMDHIKFKSTSKWNFNTVNEKLCDEITKIKIKSSTLQKRTTNVKEWTKYRERTRRAK